MAVVPARWWYALLLLTLLVANVTANRIAPDADVAIGLAFTVLLLVLAGLGGLDAHDLGLSRDTWTRGVRWGLGAVGLLLLVYALALALGPVRDSLDQPDDPTIAHVLLTALLVIPLATVIPEELAFRGLLWGRLSRDHGTRTATTVSSALFGLWHLLPALALGPANEAIVDVVGDGVAGTAARILGTLAFTAGAGVVFCELRRRSGSLLAPILLHWAVNGIGVVVVLVS